MVTDALSSRDASKCQIWDSAKYQIWDSFLIVGNPNPKKMLVFGFVGIFEYIC